MLPTLYQQFIHLSRYSRWIDTEGRRETWPETVHRYFAFFHRHLAENHDIDVAFTAQKLAQDVLDLRVMPSMRAMMTAGPALARDHCAGYNCSYTAVDRLEAFDEIMYLLMCGSGVGFSVERQFVQRLPEVPATAERSTVTIKVEDDRIGWCLAFRRLLELLWKGEVPAWDLSAVRPAGARLKTFGGRASGPEPLEDLFEFAVNLFQHAAGRRLNSIEVHDLVCKIGDVVVSGGVRRSALISFSNLSDQRMRDAKSGSWWEIAPHRALANNSAAYTERPEPGHFMREWLALYESHSGERGIYNRAAAKRKAEQIGRDSTPDFGGNPCLEILIRSQQHCNLTEVVARAADTPESLAAKVHSATILGTWQSTLTDFRHLSSVWQNNAEEERLLGVSITGIMDCPLLNGKRSRRETEELLRHLRSVARETNREWAGKLNINKSAAITCVKPSGTVSQLVNSSSGIHARHAKSYIRRVRMDKKDPMTAFMMEKGFPYEACVMKPEHTMVFSFPVMAPEEAVVRESRTAIEELEQWLLFSDNWADHTVSQTVSIREEEWPEVGAWVWKHFDGVTGVSFLPYHGGIYRQAPYEEVSEMQLLELQAQMPRSVRWEDLAAFEAGEDHTKAAQELACSAGICEL